MRSSIENSISKLLCHFQDLEAKKLADILTPAWAKAFDATTVANGWRKAGLIPFDPKAPIAEIATRKADELKQAERKQQQQQAAENLRQAERNSDGKEEKAAAGEAKQDADAALDALLQPRKLPAAKPRRYKRPQFPVGGELTDAKAIADMRNYEQNKAAAAAKKKKVGANGSGQGSAKRRRAKRSSRDADSSDESSSSGEETPVSGSGTDEAESEGEAQDDSDDDEAAESFVRCSTCKAGIRDLAQAVQCDICGETMHCRCAGAGAKPGMPWACAVCKGKKRRNTA
jgi:predicted RNA-binding Zn-ribbon protein involved in translation (DUF1610 family)